MKMLRATAIIVLLGLIPCVISNEFYSMTAVHSNANSDPKIDPLELLSDIMNCFGESTRTKTCGKMTVNDNTSYKAFWSDCHFKYYNQYLELNNDKNDGINAIYEKVNCREKYQKAGKP